MKPSFNALRRCYFRTVTSPCTLWTLGGCMPALALYLHTACPFWYIAALTWCLLWLILERSVPHGHPRLFVRELTPNFYALRIFAARWVVLQRGSPQRRTEDCKSLRRSLLADQQRLPAALPPGQYRAITHDGILRRLQMMENASDIAVSPAYTASMAAITRCITAGRCKKCKNPCRFYSLGNQPHQFYDVKFTIK